VGLPAKLLADGERPLVVLRPHVRRLARPALLLLVLAPLASYAVAAVPRSGVQVPARLVVAALAVLVAARWVVLPFLMWWSTLYVLTEERVFERRGVVRRSGHDLPLRGVTDVLIAQRLGERLLRTGTLTVTTGGRELVLADVPSVARLQRSLLTVADQVARRARAARELAGGDVGGSGGVGHLDAGHLDAAHLDPGHLDAGLSDPLPDELGEEVEGWGGTGWDLDTRDDAGPEAPSRREARRRDRESVRRLKALQAEVRRGPGGDSPLEDDGVEPAQALLPGPQVEEEEQETQEAQGAQGARILRFPRRP
jgi:hypothetical protein